MEHMATHSGNHPACETDYVHINLLTNQLSAFVGVTCNDMCFPPKESIVFAL